MNLGMDEPCIAKTINSNRWVTDKDKVSWTMARVANGKTRLLEHSDAMTLLEHRLMACISITEQVRTPL